MSQDKNNNNNSDNQKNQSSENNDASYNKISKQNGATTDTMTDYKSSVNGKSQDQQLYLQKQDSQQSIPMQNNNLDSYQQENQPLNEQQQYVKQQQNGGAMVYNPMPQQQYDQQQFYMQDPMQYDIQQQNQQQYMIRNGDKRLTNHYDQCQIEPVQHDDIDVQLENEHIQIPEHLQEEPIMDLESEWWREWENSDKLQLGNNFNLFKIPKINENVSKSTIIGVIDQSGSMGDCFQWLATEWNNQIKAKHDNTKVCIFHNLAYEADQLNVDPEMGTTDVEAGFTLLNNVLNRDQSDNCLTIIFVSDGQDNDQGTVFQRLDKLFTQIPRWRKINFLTIGVGEEFPTYLAMQLRQMYHTGENNIPPVFLVYNQQIHDNWKVTFNLVNQYLEHHDPIISDEQVQKFPWYHPSQNVYEKSWVFSKNDQINSIVLNQDNELKPVTTMTPQEVLEVGSMMVSNIQLGNLKHGETDVTYAQTCIAIKILESIKSKFWGRGKKKKEEKAQLDALFDELKSLKKDPDLKNMKDKPEEEKDRNLALKLAVGAIGAGIGLYWLTGNYGDFAELMGGMDFTGEKCFGECGVCDKVAQCMGCDSCGQCCGDIFATGQECVGGCCKYFCQVMQYLGNFICGILGE